MDKTNYRIYRMELGEKIMFCNGHTSMIRVPNGWIYETLVNDNVSCVFVPFSKEFDEEYKRLKRKEHLL